MAQNQSVALSPDDDLFLQIQAGLRSLIKTNDLHQGSRPPNMEFHLIKEKRVTFSRRKTVPDTERDPHIYHRRPVGRDLISSITADIIPLEDDPENIFKQPFCDKLKALLNKDFSSGIGFGKLKWELDVTLYLRLISNKLRRYRCNNDYIRILGTSGESNLLAKLKTVLRRFGMGVKLKAKIEKLRIPSVNGDVAPSSNVIDRLIAEDAEIKLGRCLLDGFTRPASRVGTVTRINEKGFCPLQRQGWYRPPKGSDGAGFGTCVLTITAVCNLDRSSSLEKSLFRMESAALTMGPDVVIKLAGGEEAKCHRAVLSASGSVFEAMFREDYSFLEARTGRLEFLGTYNAVVKAFLCYLYTGALIGPVMNPAFALELLKFAHKYDVRSLQHAIVAIFKYKKNEWFGQKVPRRVWAFASNFGEDIRKPLKERVLDVQKAVVKPDHVP